jgi:hypothetical protein
MQILSSISSLMRISAEKKLPTEWLAAVVAQQPGESNDFPAEAENDLSLLFDLAIHYFDFASNDPSC